MTLRVGGGQGRDANFNMNFEPSFLIVGLELVSTRSYTISVQTTLTCTFVYLPLSLSPGMTISYFCHDAKGGSKI